MLTGHSSAKEAVIIRGSPKDHEVHMSMAYALEPCATEDAAHAEIGQNTPTAAALDINLGGGRSFDLAGDRKRDGVPFIFITGYDQEVIPERFEGVAPLQKPVEFATLRRRFIRCWLAGNR